MTMTMILMLSHRYQVSSLTLSTFTCLTMETVTVSKCLVMVSNQEGREEGEKRVGTMGDRRENGIREP